ncbi:MAG: CehA/McbA family metallohydrolase [Hyphomicrobiaceae bacterium]|nr:CehA/McbA family metallohydrolase [Hyphomicrobiaceae bacterium]
MPVEAAFAAPGRFYKGNLHTHSTRSDAARDPDAVCALYRDSGYDFLALTDHFMAKFDFPIVDTRAYRTNRFTTVIGAEVHAPKTSFGELWHLLAVGLPLDFERTPPSEMAPSLAARCVAAGAYVAIAHPAWYSVTLEDAESITSAHAVEIYNHTSEVKASRGDSASLIDVMLAKGRRLTLCATDDAHFHFNDWFGGYVMVKSESLEPEALVSALKAGHYYSSQGPELAGITVSGDTLDVECSPARSVIALGRASTSAAAFGHGLTRARLSLDGLRAGGFVRVVVVDAAGRKAWSNPIWL